MNNELLTAAKDEAAMELMNLSFRDAFLQTIYHDHQKTFTVINRAMEIYAEKRWIKTSDRLPNKGERVLCNTVYGIQIGWLNVNGDWKFTNDGMQFSLEHWMPLPELPNNNNTEPKTTKQ